MKKFISLLIVLGISFTHFAEIILSQENKEQQINYFRKNALPINIKGDADFADLKVLDKSIKGKRIVLLGEFTHGSKEINLLKNRIIKYLHQKHGFKVLLLESGIGEIYSTNFLRDSLTNRQILNAGLVGPWRTQEFLELMDYLKENKNLQVGGFDVQKSGRAFANILESLIDLIGKNKNLSRDVETRNIEIVSKLENRRSSIDNVFIQEKDQLIIDYQHILQAIEVNQKMLETSGWNLERIKIIKRTIENRILYLNYYLQFRTDNDFHKRFAARDSAMAGNIIWFASQVYPNEKIIISAHNYHIAKYNEKELVMGEILAEKFGNKTYSIGVFGEKGEITDNAGKPASMVLPTEENDVQAIISHLESDASFLDIPKKQKPETKWLFENTTVNNSFVNLDSQNKLILQKSFDGLIFIKQISPPQVIN